MALILFSTLPHPKRVDFEITLSLPSVCVCVCVCLCVSVYLCAIVRICVAGLHAHTRKCMCLNASLGTCLNGIKKKMVPVGGCICRNDMGNTHTHTHTYTHKYT